MFIPGQHIWVGDAKPGSLQCEKPSPHIREVKSAMPALHPWHSELRKHLWAGEQARKAQTSHNRQMKASSGLQTSLEGLFGRFFFL